MSNGHGESIFDEIDDILPQEPNGEIVHWMQPKPLTFGPAGLSLATAGAFALGALSVVAVLGLMHLAGPERRMAPVRWVRRIRR